MLTGIRSIVIRTVNEMWKYIKRYLPYAILAALFMVGEVLIDLNDVPVEITGIQILRHGSVLRGNHRCRRTYLRT